jgi:hypothetical protein
MSGIAVENPKSFPVKVPAGQTGVVFDGVRATSIDGTTAFSLALSTLAADLYRISFTGGTDPVFRTARALSLSGVALTMTALPNASLTVSAAGTPFSAVQAGDELMIAGSLTGDASSPFGSLNQGRWTVLAVGNAGADVTLARPAGQDFQGQTQTVVPVADAQVTAYSQAGVQPGDKVKISAGFVASSRKTYTVESVTSKYIEVRSSLPLPAQAAITPGAAGMQFFSSGIRFLRVEVDQEATLVINGAAGPELSPWLAGDPEKVAEYVHTGPIYSLSIQNRSTLLLRSNIITAE